MASVDKENSDALRGRLHVCFLTKHSCTPLKPQSLNQLPIAPQSATLKSFSAGPLGSPISQGCDSIEEPCRPVDIVANKSRDKVVCNRKRVDGGEESSRVGKLGTGDVDMTLRWIPVVIHPNCAIESKGIGSGVENDGTNEVQNHLHLYPQNARSTSLIATKDTNGTVRAQDTNEEQQDDEEVEGDGQIGEADMIAKDCNLSHEIGSDCMDTGTKKDTPHEFEETTPNLCHDNVSSTPLIEKLGAEDKDTDDEERRDDEVLQSDGATSEVGMTALERNVNEESECMDVAAETGETCEVDKTLHLCHEHASTTLLIGHRVENENVEVDEEDEEDQNEEEKAKEGEESSFCMSEDSQR